MNWTEGMKRLGLVFLTVLVSLGIAAGCGGGGWLSRETGSADVPAAPAAAASERRPQETLFSDFCGISYSIRCF